MYVDQIFAVFWVSDVLPFPLIKSVLAISHERLLSLDVLFSNTFQCSYTFHYCEKINENGGEIL